MGVRFWAFEVDSEDVDEIVRTVELISGTYGGINLEDFKAPECFEIERRLKEKLSIPVFHDDQHGTAVVVGAGLLNALKIAGKRIEDVKVVMNGAGAAGIAIGKMLRDLGVLDIVMCDSQGVISLGRESGVESRELDESKREFAVETDKETLAEVLVGADVFVGVSARDVLLPEMLLSMGKSPIVFALANPDPEIGWDLAHETRSDVIMATGRSDFPNQVNNVLGFPGIFRGALDCRASEVNEEMKVAATRALAALVGVSGFRGFGVSDDEESGDIIIPDVFDKRVVVEVAFGVAEAAVKSGVAGEFDLDGYREKLEGEFLSSDDKFDEPKVGERYRHFKGDEYEIVSVVLDSDSLEKVVVYRGFYTSDRFGKNPVWVRPLRDFVGVREKDGVRVKRFEKVEKL
jgi:malate dehydrogenase (oxaloacetate-decarboxylating)(NADP+)